jgi:predicted RNA-binding Zn ribbon-like protein
LSLDFVNTVEWRTSEGPEEYLNSYADFVRWGQHTGVLTESHARRLAREASRRPDEAKVALERALDLRETLFRIFSATAAGSRPAGGDLDRFNRELTRALSLLRVAPAEDGYGWEWAADGKGLDRVLWEIVRAAAELLTSGDVKDLRECAGAGCGWLFLDTSRNRSRRWCTMGVCGNRAKARRHYEQVKSKR